MESYMYMLSIAIPMLLCFVVLVILQMLVKQDEKVSYSFRDLRLQLNDVQGESLFCQITLYPWQRHKYREIEDIIKRERLFLFQDIYMKLQRCVGRTNVKMQFFKGYLNFI